MFGSPFLIVLKWFIVSALIDDRSQLFSRILSYELFLDGLDVGGGRGGGGGRV